MAEQRVYFVCRTQQGTTVHEFDQLAMAEDWLQWQAQRNSPLLSVLELVKVTETIQRTEEVLCFKP